MAGVDPGFSTKIAPGDFIVAGCNFGCGSSRENAPIALQGRASAPWWPHPSGGSSIAARSTWACRSSRCIRRWSCSPRAISCARGWRRILENLTTGLAVAFAPYPLRVAQIIHAGGLVEYVRRKLEDG